jgi:uncharacterized membrane protein
MIETIVGRVKTRVLAMAAYGVVFALELRGLVLAAEGQRALTLPLFMKVMLCAVFFWSCGEIFWAVYKTEYKRTEYVFDGIILLLVTSVVGICFTVVQVASLIMQMYAGHEVLEKPDNWAMAFYALTALMLGGGFLLMLWIRKIRLRANKRTADLVAWLGALLLIVTRIGMRFGTTHSAIILKGVGCGALAVGMIAMIVGVVQARHSKELEASANRKPLLDAMLDTPSIQRP